MVLDEFQDIEATVEKDVSTGWSRPPFVCVYMYMCKGVCMSRLASHLVDPELVWLVNKPQGSTCLFPQPWDYRHAPPQLAFCTDAEGRTCGLLQACAALLHWLSSPQPLVVISEVLP